MVEAALPVRMAAAVRVAEVQVPPVALVQKSLTTNISTVAAAVAAAVLAFGKGLSIILLLLLAGLEAVHAAEAAAKALLRETMHRLILAVAVAAVAAALFAKTIHMYLLKPVAREAVALLFSEARRVTFCPSVIMTRISQLSPTTALPLPTLNTTELKSFKEVCT